MTAELIGSSPSEQRGHRRIFEARARPESLRSRQGHFDGGQGRRNSASFSQESLWFLEQLNPGTPAYNIPLRLRIAAKIDSAILQRSLDEIVRRHEALRTCFRIVRGSPTQIISPPRAVAARDRRSFGRSRGTSRGAGGAVVCEGSDQALPDRSGSIACGLTLLRASGRRAFIVAYTSSHRGGCFICRPHFR